MGGLIGGAMGGPRRLLRDGAERYFVSQNTDQCGRPRPMTVVVQMARSFVHTETVQLR
jgi:hypothetical protein